MISWLSSLPADSLAYALIIAVVGLIAAVVRQSWTNRGNAHVATISAEAALEKGTQEMALALLTELRKDLARIRDENHDLRTETATAISKARLAIRHLEAILTAGTSGEKRSAENAARSFLRTVGQLP